MTHEAHVTGRAPRVPPGYPKGEAFWPPEASPAPRPREPGERRGETARPRPLARSQRVIPALFAALALFLCACAPPPEERLKRTRIPADPARTLAEIFTAYPFFSTVTWTSYPRDGVTMARVTGIFDLDVLVRKTSGTRVFAARDRAAFEKAGANLGFVMEFAFEKGGEPARTLMKARIAAMGWERPAELPDDAVLMEIVRGVAGEATMKVVLDAADYCREYAPTRPGRN